MRKQGEEGGDAQLQTPTFPPLSTNNPSAKP